mgnify:CR=1 FL=1
MRKIFLMITIIIICFSCGKKEDPEYKSSNHISKTIQTT